MDKCRIGWPVLWINASIATSVTLPPTIHTNGDGWRCGRFSTCRGTTWNGATPNALVRIARSRSTNNSRTDVGNRATHSSADALFSIERENAWNGDEAGSTLAGRATTYSIDPGTLRMGQHCTGSPQLVLTLATNKSHCEWLHGSCSTPGLGHPRSLDSGPD